MRFLRLARIFRRLIVGKWNRTSSSIYCTLQSQLLMIWKRTLQYSHVMRMFAEEEVNNFLKYLSPSLSLSPILPFSLALSLLLRSLYRRHVESIVLTVYLLFLPFLSQSYSSQVSPPSPALPPLLLQWSRRSSQWSLYWLSFECVWLVARPNNFLDSFYLSRDDAKEVIATA